MGDSAHIAGLSPASRARALINNYDPEACAPGFMLAPASRAFSDRLYHCHYADDSLIIKM